MSLTDIDQAENWNEKSSLIGATKIMQLNDNKNASLFKLKNALIRVTREQERLFLDIQLSDGRETVGSMSKRWKDKYSGSIKRNQSVGNAGGSHRA
ncbi:MAG: hypothetical protein V4568_10585 [Pseudomonadota bacterium]